jgi:argininosuccinate lyase
MALLVTMKGLPLAYNKDMQEDKEAVFDTVDTVGIALRAATIVLENVTVNEARTRNAATKGYTNATELADYLVKKGVPFRSAHETVGKIVLFAIDQGRELHELSIADLRSFAAEIDEDADQALSLEATLNAKSAVGGTARARVDEALAAAKGYLEGADG